MSPNPENLSAEFLVDLSKTLREHGLTHSTLQAGSPHLNFNASDRATVFAKVSRPAEREGRAAREIRGASWAHAHGLSAPSALVPSVLEIEDEHHELRDVTLWEWVTPSTAPALYDQVLAAAQLLVAVTRVPAPAGTADIDVSWFLDRIKRRLSASTHAEASLVVAAAETAFETISARVDPNEYVWLHGDLHFVNMLWMVTGKPMLLDWESNTRGPVEYDIAQLLRSLYRDFPGHAMSERTRCAASLRKRFEAELSVDWVLVEAFMRFRAASSASHFLVHGHSPKGLARDLAILRNTPFMVSNS